MKHPSERACDGVVRSDSIGDLASRLTTAYSVVRNLRPKGYNDHFRFAFVSISQLSEAVRNALADAGVAVLPSVVDVTETAWKNGTRAVVHVDFLLVAAESGEFATIRQVGVAVDSTDKAIAKAIAAATKEMLRRTFLIASALPSDDPDSGPTDNDVRDRRFELEADIETLLAATQVGDQAVEHFRAYLLDVYAVNAWSDFAPARLIAIRDRLKSLTVEDRRQTILDKAGVADAA